MTPEQLEQVVTEVIENGDWALDGTQNKKRTFNRQLVQAGYRAALERVKARFIEACERKEDWQAVLDWLDEQLKETGA